MRDTNRRYRWAVLSCSTIAVAGLGAFWLHHLFESRKQLRYLHDYMEGREAVEDNVQVLVQNRSVLQMAASLPDDSPGNAQLAACLYGREACTVTDPTHQMGFLIRTALSRQAPLLAGTDTQPATYSGYGKLACDPKTDELCPGWQVFVWFWADCPEGKSACAKAERLHIREQIRPAGTNEYLVSNPPDAEFRSDPRRFAQTVEIHP